VKDKFISIILYIFLRLPMHIYWSEYHWCSFFSSKEA